MIKDLPWYEWYYHISSDWKLYSLHKRWIPEEVWFKWKQWYIRAWLTKNWERKIKLVHRLVAQNFIPNPNNYPIVMHLDNDTSNCHINNLKWWTASDNMQQMHKEWRANKYFKLNHPKNNLGKFWSEHPRARKINQYDLQWNFIREWWSAIEAGEELQINRKNIISCCRKIKHHSRAWKYRWEYSL